MGDGSQYVVKSCVGRCRDAGLHAAPITALATADDFRTSQVRPALERRPALTTSSSSELPQCRWKLADPVVSRSRCVLYVVLLRGILIRQAVAAKSVSPQSAVISATVGSTDSCGEGFGDGRDVAGAIEACARCRGNNAQLTFKPWAARGVGYTYCSPGNDGGQGKPAKPEIIFEDGVSEALDDLGDATHLGASHRSHFGFSKGDAVTWTAPDSSVPKGSIGTVVGFVPGAVRVKFPHGIVWRLSPSELRHAAPQADPMQSRHLQQAIEMMLHAWNAYEKKALGHDELRPISCAASDPFGGVAMFLIDSLTTLAIVGEREAFQRSVRYLIDRYHAPHMSALFDVDARVSVFELNIRALGGLLSAHQVLVANPSLVPEYANELLLLAEDLGRRLEPAFRTPTRIPLSWVNLRNGKVPGDTQETCSACAGTLLLEFGTLSRLTGNKTFASLAYHAAQGIHSRKNHRTGLIGSTLDTQGGRWTRRDGGIGASVDSYYEYLLKSYLVFGDDELLEWFASSYASAMVYMRENSTASDYWLVDVVMDSGKRANTYVSSLGAFWPGMQALMGHVQDAEGLFSSFHKAWRTFRWLPEAFDMSSLSVHPVESGYPLRPEHAESAFLLQLARAANSTRRYVEEASHLQQAMRGSRQTCGYASVQDVGKGELSDRMESFFVAETCLYLWLIFAGERALLDFYVLSTEGHPLEVLPAVGQDLDRLPDLPQVVPHHCASLCAASEDSLEEIRRQAEQSVALRNLGMFTDGAIDLRRARLLRRRRCVACVRVDEELAAAKKSAAAEAAAAARRQAAADWAKGLSGGAPRRGGVRQQHQPQQQGMCSAPDAAGGAGGTTAMAVDLDPDARLLLCHLQMSPEGLFVCSKLYPMEGITNEKLQALPPFTLVIHAVETHEDLVKIFKLGTLGPVALAPDADGSCSGDVVGHGDATNGGSASVDEPTETAAAVTSPPPPLSKNPLAIAVAALFGPEVPTAEAGDVLVGHLEVATPSQACESLRNPPDSLQGAWVLADRGACSFLDKVLNAQAAGAVGVIVANRKDEEGAVTMSGDGSQRDREVRIPAVMVNFEGGNLLRQEHRIAGEGRVVLEISGRVRESNHQMRIIVPPRSGHQMQEMVKKGTFDIARIFGDIPTESLQELLLEREPKAAVGTAPQVSGGTLAPAVGAGEEAITAADEAAAMSAAVQAALGLISPDTARSSLKNAKGQGFDNQAKDKAMQALNRGDIQGALETFRVIEKNKRKAALRDKRKVDKSRHMKQAPGSSAAFADPEKGFYAMELGDGDCPLGHEIKTRDGCAKALAALGLCHSSPWISSFDGLPKWCSHRPTTCGKEDMHFNAATYGRGRADVRPVCQAVYVGCFVENTGPYYRQKLPQWCDSMAQCQCSPEFMYVGYTNYENKKAEWSCFDALPPRRADDCEYDHGWHVGSRGWRTSIYLNPHYRPAEAPPPPATEWVVARRVLVRATPDRKGAINGHLKIGRHVRGVEIDGWLKLLPEGEDKPRIKGRETRWVPIVDSNGITFLRHADDVEDAMLGASAEEEDGPGQDQEEGS